MLYPKQNSKEQFYKNLVLSLRETLPAIRGNRPPKKNIRDKIAAWKKETKNEAEDKHSE